MDVPVLAQYTIRSKQAYIFRTNRLVEIIGASEIIKQTFDMLFECMTQAGLSCDRAQNKSPDFSMSDTRRKFQENALDAAELFCGGGNDTVLFRNRDAFRRANAAYTRAVLERYPGLLPLCVGVEVDGSDYDADHKKLMDAVDRSKNAMQSRRVENAQPFARQDRSTMQAVAVELRRTDGSAEYRSAESEAKYKMGKKIETDTENTKLLDEIARDEDRSLLAIVHADGNNMGPKIQKKLENHKDYDFCVKAMRAFNLQIDQVFTEEGPAALEKRRLELAAQYPDEPEKNLHVRWIVKGGDDATFLCNAKYALELTRAYLEGVKQAGELAGAPYSSCAGICVFHAHYPFARAYELAEQACDNAKKPVHESHLEQAWVDFHYLRSGVNGELADIRELHRTQACIARPWFVCGEQPSEGTFRLKQLEELSKLLRRAGVVRTQIKSLGENLEVSQYAGELVWKRICYNAPNNSDLEGKAKKLFSDEESLYRALYDLSDFCDLWFMKGGNEVD